MSRHLTAFVLVACLASPTLAAARSCCQAGDPATVQLVSEGCCCPQATSCAMNEDVCAQALRDEPLAVSTAFLRPNLTDLAGPFQLASVRGHDSPSAVPPGTTHPSNSFPLRL